MRRYNQLYKLAFAFFAVAAVQSCKKSNGIDNNSVIKKPYALYVGSNSGDLLNTNDGTAYKTIFATDRYPYRAIITSGDNVLFVKANVHLSENNGHNFNPTYTGFANPFTPWQQMILNVESYGKIYLASIDPTSRGVVYSEDHGKKWKVDNNFDTSVNPTALISSFTQLKNGTMFGFDDTKDSLYRKDNKDDAWSHFLQNRQQPGGMSYLSHFNNTLLLTDFRGTNGVQYSNDSGKNWTPYTGLPIRKLLCTNAPLDRVLLVGTDSFGVYRLENGRFVASNNGLENYTTVYAIAGKEDIYKNGIEKRYIYLATNRGVYRSEDLGFTWALVLEGDFGSLY